MQVRYRPAVSNDLEACVRVVQKAFTELRLRNGLGPAPFREPTFQRFTLAEDPTGLWLAETDEDGIIGFGFSWLRQRFWYLAQIFINPDIQSKGIGQELLTRTVEQAERSRADNRALITLGYNMAATGLYIKNGLYPREPLYRMSASAAALAGAKLAPQGYESSPLPAWPTERACLDDLDEAVIGFQRGSQHGFLKSEYGMRALQFSNRGDFTGYAYISEAGHIGPLAIELEADPAAVMRTAVAAALDSGAEQVSLIVPGSAEVILADLSGLGFRIEESMLLMAARPFGNWSHYLPSNPAIM